MAIPQFIYPPAITGHLDCVVFRANMNSAAVNASVHFLDEYMSKKSAVGVCMCMCVYVCVCMTNCWLRCLVLVDSMELFSKMVIAMSTSIICV